MTRERILYAIIVILALLLTFSFFKKSNPPVTDAQATDEEMITFKSLETPVEVQIIQKQNLVQTISANGVVKAWREAEIIPKVSGVITRLVYHEGDFVHADSQIVKIDDQSYRIDYQKARAQVQKALAEYGIMILSERNNQPAPDSTGYSTENFHFENTNDAEALELLKGSERKAMLANKSGLTSARLDFESAQLNLENTVIRAPFGGYLADLNLFLGGLATAGETALRIVALEKLLVEVGILETEIPFINRGTRARVEFPAFPGIALTGTVKTINPVIDAKSGTCRIQVEIDNPDLKIKPGMFAKVSIETRLFPERLLIPRDALLIRDERKVTFVYESGRAKWHYVQTGLENDDYFEVIDGLAPGDSLIISGHFNLAHDALVVLVEKE